jgi:hypothetical protein
MLLSSLFVPSEECGRLKKWSQSAKLYLAYAYIKASLNIVYVTHAMYAGLHVRGYSSTPTAPGPPQALNHFYHFIGPSVDGLLDLLLPFGDSWCCTSYI